MSPYGVFIMKKSIVQFQQVPTALHALHISVLCALLAGCNVGPKYVPPAMTAPAAFKESPTQFKEVGWMDCRAASGRGSARQVVGDLQ